LAISAFFVPVILKVFRVFPTESWMLFSALVFLPAFLTGLIFPLTAKLSPSSSPASSTYGADYVGACLGFLFATTLLMPLIGLKAVCLLTSLICLASAWILLGKLEKQKK
jgi:predicted membrane-bound spermidine synthase